MKQLSLAVAGAALVVGIDLAPALATTVIITGFGPPYANIYPFKGSYTFDPATKEDASTLPFPDQAQYNAISKWELTFYEPSPNGIEEVKYSGSKGSINISNNYDFGFIRDIYGVEFDEVGYGLLLTASRQAINNVALTDVLPSFPNWDNFVYQAPNLSLRITSIERVPDPPKSVPEPGTASALFLLGFGGMLAGTRRRLGWF